MFRALYPHDTPKNKFIHVSRMWDSKDLQKSVTSRNAEMRWICFFFGFGFNAYIILFGMHRFSEIH